MNEDARKAIAGDDDAFLRLIQTYKIDLYKTAIAYLRDQEDAIEALQEVTYRAYKSIHRVKESAYMKTWHIRIMINYCNDQLKRKKRIIMNDEIIGIQGVSENHTEMELKDAMQDLDERSRQILTMKYFHELKIKEIAMVLGCPEATVKTWPNKALKELRKRQDEGGEGGVIMFEDEEEKLMEYKKSVDNISVPETALDMAILTGFQKAKFEKNKKTSCKKMDSNCGNGCCYSYLINYIHTCITRFCLISSKRSWNGKSR
ncbi:sigma-70 family RNA polymerase sigma factor [Oceanobacillus arenosus]|uniref:sigma-70 family RNA polymerase sigma factor n=1 Tax=Oceanobacillus arenosus TaxID=1229153 RepID=UPI001FE5EEAC|nr:sigma-70 family RNA polymerase sigma factor [Oceanobacillus arenosus]